MANFPVEAVCLLCGFESASDRDVGKKCFYGSKCDGIMAKPTQEPKATAVNPPHYDNHAVTPIDLIEAYDLNYCRGNAVKYLARADEKNKREDICKALWYILRDLGFPMDRIKAITMEAEGL